MTTDIAPRIVDGEPICGEMECPYFLRQIYHRLPYAGDSITDSCQIVDMPLDGKSTCIPGLRRQRDEARKLYCSEKARWNSRDLSPERVADSRGWAYLYEGEEK